MQALRNILALILLTFGCTTAASAAPPTVNATRAVVIAGPIARGNLAPLGNRLLALSTSDPKTPVDVILDSPGGDVVTGYMFVSQLEAVRARGTTVRCFVPTLAASMAFQILVHCDERYTLDYAFLLWHRVRVFGIETPITAPLAGELSKELQRMDTLIFRELVGALGDDLDVDDISYHFERETLHIGQGLAEIAPGFITSYAAIPGLFEALASAPRSQQARGLFGDQATFRPGQIVYIWSGAL
jgi:ATP-dependent protease ClpP protease subunit